MSLIEVRVPGRLAPAGPEVSPSDRLLVTGGNGAGKSTLLAVPAGRLPAQGEVVRRRGLTVGLDKPVGYLSVGQRRRLALALLVARPPQLLLLDEPTDPLSPALSDELEAAWGPGPGAIVVASHDRWLRRRRQGREHRLER